MRALAVLSPVLLLLLAGCRSAPPPTYRLVMPALEPPYTSRVVRTPALEAGPPAKVLVLHPEWGERTARQRAALERGLVAGDLRVAFAAQPVTVTGWGEEAAALAAAVGAQAVLELQGPVLDPRHRSRHFTLDRARGALSEVEEAGWLAAPAAERYQVTMQAFHLLARLVDARQGELLASLELLLPEVNYPANGAYQATLVGTSQVLLLDVDNRDQVFDSRACEELLLEAIGAELVGNGPR